MIMIMGNGGSYLGRYFQNILVPYANQIGMNTTWNFFSPDPASVMYLKYRVYFNDEKGIAIKDPIEEYYPESGRTSEPDIRKRRHSFMARYMILDPKRVQVILAPWICKKYPGATDLFIENIIEMVPPFDAAVQLTQSGLSEENNRFPSMQLNYNCLSKDDEVSL